MELVTHMKLKGARLMPWERAQSLRERKDLFFWPAIPQPSPTFPTCSARRSRPTTWLAQRPGKPRLLFVVERVI
jgi:hypothetical protein